MREPVEVEKNLSPEQRAAPADHKVRLQVTNCCATVWNPESRSLHELRSLTFSEQDCWKLGWRFADTSIFHTQACVMVRQ